MSKQKHSRKRPSIAADSPARMFRLLADTLAYVEKTADSSSSFYNSLKRTYRGGSSSRTSPVCCRRTEDGTWEPCSGGWRNSGMGWPGGFLTLETLEYPNIAVGSSLSDVVEVYGVPPKFYLSPEACIGVLRRIPRRSSGRIEGVLRLALMCAAGAIRNE